MAPKTCNNTFFTSNSIIVKLHFSPPYPRKIIIRHFSVPSWSKGQGFCNHKLFRRCRDTQVPLHTDFFYTVSFNLFYTEKILGTFFSRMCLYALRLTRARDHTRAFTHKYHSETFAGKILHHTPKKNTQVLVHTKTVYMFFFYMQELLCANVFTCFFCT